MRENKRAGTSVPDKHGNYAEQQNNDEPSSKGTKEKQILPTGGTILHRRETSGRVNFVTQATGGPGARHVRREEWSINRGDGVWAKFPGTSGKFKLRATKGKPQTQTPRR
jgi:hypothetical protein